MTPFQLAEKYCSNHKGACLGLGISDTGKIYRWRPQRKSCDVSKCRCEFFEHCVATAVRSMEKGPKRDGFVEAIRIYIRSLPELEQHNAKNAILGRAADEKWEELQPANRCLDCQEPVAGLKRICEKCAKRRANESKRTSKAKKSTCSDIDNQPLTSQL